MVSYVFDKSTTEFAVQRSTIFISAIPAMFFVISIGLLFLALDNCKVYPAFAAAFFFLLGALYLSFAIMASANYPLAFAMCLSLTFSGATGGVVIVFTFKMSNQYNQILESDSNNKL